VREAATICPRLARDLDLLTLKVVSKSRVTWATSVVILVFLGLSVLDLGPMYATDVRRQTSSSLNAPRRRNKNKLLSFWTTLLVYLPCMMSLRHLDVDGSFGSKVKSQGHRNRKCKKLRGVRVNHCSGKRVQQFKKT